MSKGTNAAIDWLASISSRDQEELRIWRETYPHRAPYFAEEARAKAEGRQPNYPPPIAIG